MLRREGIFFPAPRKLAPGELGFSGEGVGEVFVTTFAEAAKAPLTLLVVGDGFEQMKAAEVRPETFGDKDLSVGDLPQQEI